MKVVNCYLHQEHYSKKPQILDVGERINCVGTCWFLTYQYCVENAQDCTFISIGMRNIGTTRSSVISQLVSSSKSLIDESTQDSGDAETVGIWDQVPHLTRSGAYGGVNHHTRRPAAVIVTVISPEDEYWEALKIATRKIRKAGRLKAIFQNNLSVNVERTGPKRYRVKFLLRFKSKFNDEY